jgi:hypothetical protein
VIVADRSCRRNIRVHAQACSSWTPASVGVCFGSPLRPRGALHSRAEERGVPDTEKRGFPEKKDAIDRLTGRGESSPSLSHYPASFWPRVNKRKLSPVILAASASCIVLVCLCHSRWNSTRKRSLDFPSSWEMKSIHTMPTCCCLPAVCVQVWWTVRYTKVRTSSYCLDLKVEAK